MRSAPGRVRVRRGGLGLAAVVIGGVLLADALAGTTTVRSVRDGTPIELVLPARPAGGEAPGVVVAHGFAGSARLMRAWSLALARAGFIVAAPDLAGHGRSTVPLDAEALAAAVADAVAVLREQPGVDASRIGLLGHSMGSGAVLAAVSDGRVRPRAVVLVSPTDGVVDADSPPDLLLLAGSLEARFVANARDLLARAGGTGGAPGDGRARDLVVVPRVEHVTILFSATAHALSVEWLGAALDHVPVTRRPARLMTGWSLLLLGSILVWQVVAAGLATPAPDPVRRRGTWPALVAGVAAATASLVVLVRSIDVAGATGLLVGGEVAIWLLLVGALWLRFGDRPARPDGRDAGWMVLATSAGVGLGATMSLAWLPWWPVAPRAVLLPLAAAACLPVSVAAATALHGRRGAAAVGTWAAVAAVLTVGLGAMALTVPGTAFLILLLPLVPAVLAVIAALAGPLDRPWASGAAGAVLLGWLLVVLFPLG